MWRVLVQEDEGGARPIGAPTASDLTEEALAKLSAKEREAAIK